MWIRGFVIVGRQCDVGIFVCVCTCVCVCVVDGVCLVAWACAGVSAVQALHVLADS